ncbi:hypothetical protein KAT92_03035, partial [Candidatus Babeliales bacterium]|nr:hypothetical protein [Candidatus Babeliales bacterium]
MEEILLLLFLQIVLESLPVSSSGHFVLLEKFFSLGAGVGWTQALDHFAHGPSVLIILLVFRREWWGIVRGLLGYPSILFALQKTRDERWVGRATQRRLLRIFFKIAGLTILSCSIT